MRRTWLWGAAAAAVYVAVALAVGHFDSLAGRVIPRPLYDGLAPAAPYRFMSPPPDLAVDNEKPEPGEGVVELTAKGSSATSVSTFDGQMQVVFQKGAFAAKKKAKRVEVDLTPLVPPPPVEVAGGLRIEGNAYRITATYAPEGGRAEPKRALTVVLRYPYTGTKMVRRAGRAWTVLRTQISQASLQLFAETDTLGAFAAAGKQHRRWPPWLPYAAAAFGVAAGVVGYLSGRRGWLRRRKDGDRSRKRKPPKRRRRAVPR